VAECRRVNPTNVSPQASRLTVFPSRYRFSPGNKKAPDKYDTPAVRDKDNLGSGTMRCHNCHNDRNNEMAQAESVTSTRSALAKEKHRQDRNDRTGSGAGIDTTTAPSCQMAAWTACIPSSH